MHVLLLEDRFLHGGPSAGGACLMSFCTPPFTCVSSLPPTCSRLVCGWQRLHASHLYESTPSSCSCSTKARRQSDTDTPPPPALGEFGPPSLDDDPDPPPDPEDDGMGTERSRKGSKQWLCRLQAWHWMVDWSRPPKRSSTMLSCQERA